MVVGIRSKYGISYFCGAFETIGFPTILRLRPVRDSQALDFPEWENGKIKSVDPGFPLERNEVFSLYGAKLEVFVMFEVKQIRIADWPFFTAFRLVPVQLPQPL